MVMAYIIFVNPAILGFSGIPALQGQGPPFAATPAATCLVAGVMTIVTGLVAHYPLSLSSGIGLFVLFIGLNAAGIVKSGPPGVPMTLGVLTSAPVAVALFGLLLMLWFQSRGMTGGLLLGILATTALAMIVNAWTE